MTWIRFPDGYYRVLVICLTARVTKRSGRHDDHTTRGNGSVGFGDLRRCASARTHLLVFSSPHSFCVRSDAFCGTQSLRSENEFDRTQAMYHPDIRTAADLGAAIRQRRKELRLSQEDIADAVGVGRKFVSTVENGKPTAQIGLVLDLCRELGIQIELKAGRDSGTRRPGGGEIVGVDKDSGALTVRRNITDDRG